MTRTFVAIIVLATAIVIAGCNSDDAEHNFRKHVESQIPIGSSQESILRFLKANSFEVIVDPSGVRPPNGKDNIWISSSVESSVLWMKRYIVADFFIDKSNGTMVEYRVYSIYPNRLALF